MRFGGAQPAETNIPKQAVEEMLSRSLILQAPLGDKYCLVAGHRRLCETAVPGNSHHAGPNGPEPPHPAGPNGRQTRCNGSPDG